MQYREEMRDLFSVSDDYYLAHCISEDFKLGAGIAVEFNKRFDMGRKLKENFQDFSKYMNLYRLEGECILIDKVLNLVTKQKYYHKPTYKSMKQALQMMKKVCIANNIYKVAMPTIGAGLDRLSFDKVSKIIQSVFDDTDIEILVCKLK